MRIGILAALPFAAGMPLTAPLAVADQGDAPWAIELSDREAVDPGLYTRCGSGDAAGSSDACPVAFKTSNPSGSYICEIRPWAQLATCGAIPSGARAASSGATVREGEIADPTSELDITEWTAGSVPEIRQDMVKDLIDKAPLLPDRKKISAHGDDDSDQVVCWTDGGEVGCAAALDHGFTLSRGGDSGW